MGYAGSCYANSISTWVPAEPAAGLKNLGLKGYGMSTAISKNVSAQVYV